MWERTLSQKLVRLFCEQKVVDESKADAYVYGYELLISSVVSVLLVILVSAVCGDVRYSLSFLIGFIPQRMPPQCGQLPAPAVSAVRCRGRPR